MSAPTVLATGRYALVPSDCAVRFTARSLGLPVRGGFDVRSGEVRIDADGAAVTAVLDAGSFRTRSPRRDRDVCSPRFLDVEQHPDIVFSGRWDGPGTPLVGHLTVRGVSAPVALKMDGLDGAGAGATARARTRFDRRAYPVGPRSGPIGRWCDVELEIVLRSC